MRYIRCIHSSNTICSSNGAFLIVLLTIEGILFGLFTLCMMFDQYSVITTGSTQIDRLKGEINDSLGIREVFGGVNNKFSFSWLIPNDVWFPRYK